LPTVMNREGRGASSIRVLALMVPRKIGEQISYSKRGKCFPPPSLPVAALASGGMRITTMMDIKAHWFTHREHGGFPVEKAALGSCDLSVLHIGGEWEWLVRQDLP
jgi:hypothetical protein